MDQYDVLRSKEMIKVPAIVVEMTLSDGILVALPSIPQDSCRRSVVFAPAIKLHWEEQLQLVTT